MTRYNIRCFIFLLLLSLCFHTHANDKLIAGTISCSAEWNELCEDKKIISVPDNYRLCHHEIIISENSGDTSHKMVASDQKSITVYFRAKGNQDRSKPKGAFVKLNVELSGVKDTEACENITPIKTPELSAPISSNTPELSQETPASTSEPLSVDTASNVHACACSQWLNWMKVEHCLSKEQRSDRPPCDSYEVTIQCVNSKDECRSIQKENCPQVVGLNQSTSLKRLFIENSPYCQK